MWKKDEIPAPAPSPQLDSLPRAERAAAMTPRPVTAERATIGRSIAIRGDVTGDEDLLIQGRVEGTISLKQHSVTIGTDGDVRASVVGRVVIVEGKVEGNINSDEQIILRSSAWVQGDISAPRVVLEDGARFRGGVDMGEVDDRVRAASDQATPSAKRSSADGSSGHAPGHGSTDRGRAEGGGEKRKSGVDATADLAS